MCHFLSHSVVRIRSGAAFRWMDRSMFNARTSSPGSRPGRGFCLTFLGCLILIAPSFAQVTFPTNHADNNRSNANTNETLLAPSNVNQYSFGRLFSVPVDYVVMAQPLYVPT